MVALEVLRLPTDTGPGGMQLLYIRSASKWDFSNTKAVTFNGAVLDLPSSGQHMILIFVYDCCRV